MNRIQHYGRNEDTERLFRSESLNGNNVEWLTLVCINIFDPYDEGVEVRVMHERAIGSNLPLGTKKWPVALIANTSQEKLNLHPWHK